MRNKGFTLIELVVVIVILGILAVVAAPKFMGLQREARIADLKGLEGSLKAANEMVYAKAAMKGLEHSQQADWRSVKKNQIVINGKDVTLYFGHIKATESNIKGILDISDDDWHLIQTFDGDLQLYLVYMVPKTASAFNAKDPKDVKDLHCYLSYGFPKNGAWDIPQYHLVTSGC
ncbi:type II secretion system protein [Photobacterium carnosum]|uniref:type II secretion system protein n=1 Tax=Photobacterium carnosum TaxID=2023717 RepID=UPI001F8BC4E6|nr:prepilin-type N-terminal cleavage/methylation domain-containing protein [Photobacterium carnosum]MCD9530163.1 prepilin-type N-terminal cleavage/methylation domain-containing protein [Photobacterium carnosum]MCF2153331.1 prepilin-type N-terminal cleavage/methylation domain-containing protein [Photobacterium carnosum]MCF2215091.1 prepilin-type N-terminal cleavage/methylation domain-containing protein [Photobacterium carnosum]